jgi:hypothetical protein
MIIGPDTRVMGSFLESSQMRYRKVQICAVSSIAATDLVVWFEQIFIIYDKQY